MVIIYNLVSQGEAVRPQICSEWREIFELDSAQNNVQLNNNDQIQSENKNNDNIRETNKGC